MDSIKGVDSVYGSSVDSVKLIVWILISVAVPSQEMIRPGAICRVH